MAKSLIVKLALQPSVRTTYALRHIATLRLGLSDALEIAQRRLIIG